MDEKHPQQPINPYGRSKWMVEQLLDDFDQANGLKSVYPDGTCVRDYVHESDLCDAHRLALESLIHGAGSQQYNLVNGNGYSVQEVIEPARRVTGQTISTVDAPRRDGDPDRLVADASQAKKVLGCQPQWTSLDEIIAHTRAWE